MEKQVVKSGIIAARRHWQLHSVGAAGQESAKPGAFYILVLSVISVRPWGIHALSLSSSESR